jgi:hypothetical protein
MQDPCKSLIGKYRFLFKDLHGNDFFLNKNSVEYIKNLFERTYSDEELVKMSNGNFSPERFGFVENFITEVQNLLISFENRKTPSGEVVDGIPVTSGIKDKKRYEINIMSGILDKKAKELKIDTMVDFGGGHGHLAKWLSKLGYKVIIIDEVCAKNRVHFNYIIGRVSKEKLDTFEQVLREALRDSKCIFYSLHACGSLSDCMIELFCSIENALGLVNVGCCYNLINYSISGKPKWSENEKMAACQCPARWTLESMQNTFWKNFHRSMIQKLARDRKIALNYQFFKVNDPADVKEYISLLSQLKIDFDLNEYYTYFLPNKSTFCTWWTLRALYGQLVEYSIVEERTHFINNNRKAKAHSNTIFDPIKSPRRYCIFAEKYPLSVETGLVTYEKTSLPIEEGEEEKTET